MSKIGIEIKIDVTKIDKARIYHGAKGKYISLTSFVDLDSEDQYGNNGFITHAKNKDEGKNIRLPILGNVKVFWRDTKTDDYGVPTTENDGGNDESSKDFIPF